MTDLHIQLSRPDHDDPLYPIEVAPEWHDRAACRGADISLWFPPRGGSIRKAKAICASCPVRTDCLDYAIEHGERFGIWGGLSEKERRIERRRREVA